MDGGVDGGKYKEIAGEKGKRNKVKTTDSGQC
jgi:hypothetical protein